MIWANRSGSLSVLRGPTAEGHGLPVRQLVVDRGRIAVARVSVDRHVQPLHQLLQSSYVVRVSMGLDDREDVGSTARVDDLVGLGAGIDQQRIVRLRTLEDVCVVLEASYANLSHDQVLAFVMVSHVPSLGASIDDDSRDRARGHGRVLGDIATQDRQRVALGNARDTTDPLAVAPYFGRFLRAALRLESSKAAIDPASEMDLRHRFLAEIATLVVVDSHTVDAGLLRERFRSHLPAPARHTVRHADRFELLLVGAAEAVRAERMKQ